MATLNEAEQVDRNLLALVKRIDGTIDERRAYDYFANTVAVADLSQCMTEHGQTYWSPFIDHWFGHTISSNEETATAPLHDDAYLANLQASAAVDRRDAMVDDWLPSTGIETGSPYDVALEACDPLLGGRAPGVGEQRLSERLGAELLATITAVNEQVGSDGDYEDCMAASGFKVADNSFGNHGYQGLLGLLFDHQPSASDIPPPGSTGGDEAWTTFEDEFRHAMDADATCRTGTYLVAMPILDGKLAEFTKAHATDLKTLDAGWAEVVAWASDHGFDASADPVIDLSQAPSLDAVSAG